MAKRNRPPGFLNADRIAALLLLAVVLPYGWESARLTAALQVDVVGPGFFPKILTWLGAILAVLLFVGRSPIKEAGNDTGGADSDWAAMMPVALLLGYVLLMEPLGFPLATAGFLTLTFRYLGHPAWKSALLLAAAISAAIFCVFHFGLDIRLPLGPFGRLA